MLRRSVLVMICLHKNIQIKMEKELKITVIAPIECTDEHFQEWCEYCLNYRGDISIENPLHEYDLKTTYVEF